MTKNIFYAPVAFAFLASTAVAQEEEFAGPDDQVVPVAEEAIDPLQRDAADDEVGNDPGEAPADDGIATEEKLLIEFDRYRRALSDGTLDAADLAAKRIVEMAIKVYGPQSRETANALNNLGIVQHSAGQFDAAAQNFSSAVEIIEAVEDRLNDALVNPLKGLGAAQLSNGRPGQAYKSFNRAAHITRVNEGPHNLAQVEILESIAETQIRLGDVESARDILDRIHIINVKHFEKNPLGLLPSLLNRADWQHRAGYYGEERATYRRAIRIIESSSNKDNPLLIEPLRRLGESFYYIDLSMSAPQQRGLISTGEVYFKRAARLAERSEEVDWRQRTRTMLALADYYTFVESQNRSRKIYKDVWEMLSTDEEKIAQRDEWFNDPVALRPDPLPAFAGRSVTGAPPNEVATGKIVVDYSVSERGRVRDLRTEAFPPEFSDMQRMVHREIRRRVHRPRIIDGAPVQANALIYEHTFTYLQSDLDALREAKTEAGKETAAPAEEET